MKFISTKTIALSLLSGTLIVTLAWWLKPDRNYTPVPVANQSVASGTHEPDAAVFSQYAGAASCRDCHAKEFASWAGSNHGMAERAIDPAMDHAAFDPAHSIVHATQKSEARLRDGRCEMITAGLTSPAETHAIDRVIGHDPLRQFLV
ncbi:MAG: hypothetical protein WCN98_05735, partial [Verrucomicrobiaceae bacterium]